MGTLILTTVGIITIALFGVIMLGLAINLIADMRKRKAPMRAGASLAERERDARRVLLEATLIVEREQGVWLREQTRSE